MNLSSPEFNHEEMIPKKFTCDGRDLNPALAIKDLPHGTESLVLIVDDPDAPGKTWIHWILFNIPPADSISENSKPGTQGLNDFGIKDYGGPCPPSGTHRYFFKLYALDQKLDLPEGARKDQVEKAMEGHVLDKTELIGKYQR